MRTASSGGTNRVEPAAPTTGPGTTPARSRRRPGTTARPAPPAALEEQRHRREHARQRHPLPPRPGPAGPTGRPPAPARPGRDRAAVRARPAGRDRLASWTIDRAAAPGRSSTVLHRPGDGHLEGGVRAARRAARRRRSWWPRTGTRATAAARIDGASSGSVTRRSTSHRREPSMRRRLLHLPVEVRPPLPHHPHHDGVVEEGVRQHDGGRASRRAGSTRRAAPGGRPAPAPHGRHHDGRQHERDRHEHLHQGPAPEPEAAQRPRPGRASTQRERAVDSAAWPTGEGERVEVLADGVAGGAELPLPVDPQAGGDDVGHRPREQHGQEQQRPGEQGPPGSQPQGHPRTNSFQRSMTSSRVAPKANGSTTIGSGGSMGEALEHVGQRGAVDGPGTRTSSAAGRPAPRRSGGSR